MKVFNLTDVATPDLELAGHVGKTLTIWRHIIPPGGSVEVGDSEKVRQEVAHYISLGMVSVDKLPVEYVVRREKQQRKK